MKPFCGRKEKFLTPEEIDRFNCNTNKPFTPAICKKPMNNIAKFKPCAYFIMRKEDGKGILIRDFKRDPH